MTFPLIFLERESINRLHARMFGEAKSAPKPTRAPPAPQRAAAAAPPPAVDPFEVVKDFRRARKEREFMARTSPSAVVAFFRGKQPAPAAAAAPPPLSAAVLEGLRKSGVRGSPEELAELAAKSPDDIRRAAMRRVDERRKGR